MIRVLVAAVSMMVLVGCAGSADGKVAGHSLSVADAIFGTYKDDNGKNLGLQVYLADKPNLCDSLKANRQPKGGTAISFFLIRIGDNDVLAPDAVEYTVKEGLSVFTSKGNNASVSFDRQDSSCASTITNSAGAGKSGLIKLTNVKAETGGTANATFDVTFGDGSMKGSFNATYCDLQSLSDNPNCE
jgi:hypothetical protein